MKRRSTKSKRDILQILKNHGSAMSHDMLETRIGEYDRTTIYRILNRFREDGIIHRIVAADGKQYFAICTNCQEDEHRHDHIHFQCNNCRKVECLEQEPKIDLPKGYVLEGFNGLVSGICGDCVKVGFTSV